MKKILMIIAAVAVLASCGSSSSPADQAVSYAKQIEKAMADQDYEALMKVQSEMLEWQSGLSEEEFQEAEAAFTKYMLGSELGEELMGDEDFLDTASEYAVDAYDVASEYAKDAYDVASEYAEDAYEKAEELLEDLW